MAWTCRQLRLDSAKKGALKNVKVGSVLGLPYKDNTFGLDMPNGCH